jgi:hypothetical protein
VKFWFITDTPRLAKERGAVEGLATEASWFSLQRWCLFEGRFCAEGVIRVHGADYPVRLIYPDQFPQVPAWVEPQDAKAKWSKHQYGEGGTLCLELRPDTWEETATGADVLTSAFRLLDVENPLGEESERGRAPSAHNVGAIQSYDWLSNPLFITTGCLERIRAGSATSLTAGYSAYLDEVFPVFVHDELDRSASQRPPTDSRGFSEVPVYVSRNGAPASKPGTRDEVRTAAALAEDADTQLAAAQFALVLFAGGDGVSAIQVIGDGPPLRLDIVVLENSGGQRSGRAPDAAKKRIAIVGAGSVGSKLAECLVRSGVHRLTLVDGDVMLPANLERHALDWRDVGYRKVKALKRRLLSIVPGARVKEIADNLNWQRSARTHAWQVEALARCDVIVDATGDVATALFLGAVAAANVRPFVSIEVFEGGIGALIASCVPDRDPPYAKARAAFTSWCEIQGVPAPKGTGRRYEALSDEGTPLIADDAAVTMAAGHGARVVLDIVDGRPAPREAAWLLVGFQKEWLFDGHGHTVRMSVGAPEERTNSPVDEKALAFATAVVKEAVGESDSSE